MGTKNNYDIIIQYITSCGYYNDEFQLNILNPIENAYKIYKNNNINNENIINNNNYNYVFTIKQLYKYIFLENLGEINLKYLFNNPNENNDLNIDNIINNKYNEKDFNIIDILINDTLVDNIHNLLTVLTKYSSDFVNVDIKRNIERNNDYITINWKSIYNFNNDDLMSLFLPYYTLDNKYYLIFKNIISLEVETIYNNTLFKWLDKPIIKNNRIFDIKRNYTFEDYVGDNYTLFKIKLKYDINDYIKLISFIQDEFSVIKKITLNNNLLRQDNKMVLQNEYGSGYLIQFTKKSLVLINNYILQDLETFKIKIGIDIKSYYSTGIIFIFNDNLFEIIQGNKYIPKINKKIILNCINELGLCSLFTKQLNDELGIDYVQNYYSKEIILPSIYGDSEISKSNFILYYNINGINLANVINMLNFKKSINNIHYLMNDVAIKWFINKTSEPNKINIEKRIDDKLYIFAKTFIETFWKIGKELKYYNIYFNKECPKLLICETNYDKSGLYYANNNIIGIDYKAFMKYDLKIENIMNYILNYGSNLYGKEFPSSTVIH